MTYLTYDEYKQIGGTLDETAFSRCLARACAIIDVKTHGRLVEFTKKPELVQVVCADLVDYLALNNTGKAVTSVSQSAGGVSESESYATKTADDYITDIDRILEPLASITTSTGVSLLYRGAMC